MIIATTKTMKIIRKTIIKTTITSVEVPSVSVLAESKENTLSERLRKKKQKNGGFQKSNTAWKVSKDGVFSGPYFPAFGLNTEIYGVNTDQKKLRIWTLFTQCGRIGLRSLLPRLVKVNLCWKIHQKKIAWFYRLNVSYFLS